MPLEFAAKIRRLPRYPTASAYGDRDLALLASNESPEPPLPSVIEAANRALSSVNRYPDPGATELRRALSRRYDVPVGRIAVGNGSCDILIAAGEALLEPGAEIVHAWPSFSVYPHIVATTGATAVRVPLDDEDRHDLDAIADAVTVATRVVIVCNPNNPTSTAVPMDEIAAMIERIPRYVCVLIDEAYCEFNLLDDPDASIALLRTHPNVVLLRTFSKVHGMCGLRVGFALCGSQELCIALDQVRQPFHTSAVAQAAAVVALDHGEEVERRVERAVAARLDYDERLRELGIVPAESQANFCWFDLGEGRDEQAIVDGLAQRGVIVRAGSPLGREGALRVTYGTPAENDRFFAALRDLL